MSMQAAAVSASLKQTGRSQGTNEADTNVSEQRFPWCNVTCEVEVRAGSAAKVVCSCSLSCTARTNPVPSARSVRIVLVPDCAVATDSVLLSLRAPCRMTALVCAEHPSRHGMIRYEGYGTPFCTALTAAPNAEAAQQRVQSARHSARRCPVQNDCKPRARSQLIASTYCIDACHLLVLHLCRQLSHHR